MGTSKKTVTRRTLLTTGGAALAAAELAGSVPSFASDWLSSSEPPVDRALSRPTGATRALVCIYLAGGCDSNNVIVPLDDLQYSAYRRARRSLAVPKRDLLPIEASGGARYGLHPALEELHRLYQARSL